MRTYEWLAAFAGDGDEDDGPFLFDVDRMVAAADELVGVPLGALLAELGVRRATVLAEDMLTLVPWWALPSLEGLQIMTAGSAAELLDRQAAPPDAAPRTGLLVANPTRDLPVTGLACRGVEDALRTAGFSHRAAPGRRPPPRTRWSARVPGRTVFHFGGHGRSDADYSALELHPDPPPEADPFPAWADGVEAWRVAAGDLDPEVADEPWSWIHRWADVEGEGRLHERHWNRGDRVDRWLERTAGTLAASYQGETCIAAERAVVGRGPPRRRHARRVPARRADRVRVGDGRPRRERADARPAGGAHVRRRRHRDRDAVARRRDRRRRVGGRVLRGPGARARRRRPAASTCRRWSRPRARRCGP